MALPNEDLDEIERLSESIHRELNPKGMLKGLLVRRVAFLACRLDRCERYEIAMLSNRVRHAVTAYTEGRITQVDVFASKLNNDPTTSVRNLQAMPEGLEFLIYHLGELRTKLADETRDDWGMGDCSNLGDLLGQPTGPSRFNRILILSESVRGYFANVPAGEWAGLGESERVQAARTELLAIIEAEIARLKEVHGSLNHKAFEQDRAEAVDRALFDPSKEATLARKYEAATERSLYRALRELGQLDDVVDEPETEVDLEAPSPPSSPVEPTVTTSRPRGSLASFFQKTLTPTSIEEKCPIRSSEGEMITPEGRPNVDLDDRSGQISPARE